MKDMPQFSLSVLDQSPVRAGATPADAVAETIRLAQATERFGYARFWLAEHHGTDGLASSSPEIMITRVAAATSAIRVGSGGVMLSHYSPYKVAENFRLLETMYPGRIDLGIGRAPGSDQPTARALAYGSQVGIEYFPTKIADLAGFLTDSLPPGHAFAGVRATPEAPRTPDIWLLGSSDYSAAYAARFGLAFSFAHFISPQGGERVMQAYRDAFKPSALLAEPLGNIGVFVICAETEEKARHLAASRDLWRLRRDRGQRDLVPTEEEALSYPYTPAELMHVEMNRQRNVVGTPEQVKAQLVELGERYGVSEFVVLTICHDFEAKIRSYELLAEAFGLTPRR